MSKYISIEPGVSSLNFMSCGGFCNFLGDCCCFRVVETLMLLAKKVGCYKISLECKDPLLSYYTQFGLKLEDGQNYLCKRFFH